ncbi:MAG TPA: phage holin family protein [Candidatus Angelobacter sp.]
MKLLIRWLINAISLWVVANLNIGVSVPNFKYALIAALVIGLVNATLGIFLKVITFPLTILTFGIFLIIINAAMLKVAAWLLHPEFRVRDWTTAIIGAILLSIVSSLLHWLVGDKHRRRDY